MSGRIELSRYWNALGWCVVVGTLAWIFLPTLIGHAHLAADPRFVNDDARAQIPPFFRYEDSRVFVHDYIVEYYLDCFFPRGYRALYMLAGWFGGVEQLSKALPYLWLAVTVIAMAAAAARFGGKVGAFTAAALCLGGELYLHRMTGGLPRSFAFPIFASALAALAYGCVWPLAALVWMGAAFYPVAAVPVAFALGGLLLVMPPADRGAASEWSLRKRSIFLASVGLLALVLVLPPAIAGRRYGGLIREAQVGEFPEAGPGGRFNSDDRPPHMDFISKARQVLERETPLAGDPWSTTAHQWLLLDASQTRAHTTLWTLLALSAAGWSLLCTRHAAARRVALIFGAVILGHSLARLGSPYLFSPERYISYPIPLLATLFLSSGVAGFIPARYHRASVTRTALVTAFAGVTLAFYGGYGSSSVGLNINLRTEDRIYDFVRQLPPDVRIAAWPSGLANNLPYVTRRSVLVNYESHQAFHVDFVLEMRKRVQAVIDAYFATTVEPLRKLRDEFGVTHFLVDTRMLRDRSARYFKPFAKPVRRTAEEAQLSDVEVWRHVDTDAAVFKDRRHVVLDLRKLVQP